MGLDLALGALILFQGVRGWLKGFVVQAVRLGGLVAAVFAAEPVREQVKPYVLEYVPKIPPEHIDRILWWASAVASYFVIVGVVNLVVAVSRRQPHGLTEPDRLDQFAGFGLGVAKGLLVAAFAVAALDRYQPLYRDIDWTQSQARESYAWAWNSQYHPAAQIWNSGPVRQFVAHVHLKGIQGPSFLKSPEGSSRSETADRSAQSTRSPKLSMGRGADDAPSDGFDMNLDQAMRVLRGYFQTVEESGTP